MLAGLDVLLFALRMVGENFCNMSKPSLNFNLDVIATKDAGVLNQS